MAAGSIIIDLLMKTGSFETDTKRAEKRLKEFEKSAERMGKIVAAAGVAIGSAFIVMTKRTIDSMDEMAKMAQQAGVTVEALSSLGYAADLSGLSTQEMTRALGLLSKGLADAAQGTGEALKGFERMGMTASDMTSADGALIKIAERFAQMEDGAEKTSIAIQLFGGRIGQRLIPFLNMGADGIQRLQEEATKLGVTMDTKTAKAAEEFNDNLTRLSASLTGLMNNVMIPLLPVLNDYVNIITDAWIETDEFRNESEKLTKSGLTEFFNGVAFSIAVVADSMVGLVKLAGAVSSSFSVVSADISALSAGATALLNNVTPGINLISPGSTEKANKEFAEALQNRNNTLKKANQAYIDLWNYDGSRFADAVKAAQMSRDISLQGITVSEPLGRPERELRQTETPAPISNAIASIDAQAKAVQSLTEEYAKLADFQNTESVEAQRTFAYGWSEAFKQYMDAASNSATKAANMFDVLTGSMNSAISRFVETGKFSFSDFASSVIKDMITIELQAQASRVFSTIVNAIGGAIAGSFGSSGQVVGGSAGTMTIGENGFAEGGYTGMGGKYDPAGIVHRGEYVINADQTKRLGVGFLDRLNKGYANGGYVGAASSAMGGNVNINIKNEAGADGYKATAQAKMNTDGGLNIDVLVRRVVSSDMSNNGALAQQMANTFGLRRAI